MKNPKSKMKTAEEILLGMMTVMVMAFAVLTTLLSLFQTTYFDLYQAAEIPRYQRDHPLIMIILTAVFLAGLVWLEKSEKLFVNRLFQIKHWYLVVAGCAGLFFILVYRGTATADSLSLSNQAKLFLQGDGSGLVRGYLAEFPFQLGAVAVIQLVYFIFGADNFPAFALLNLLAIIITLSFLKRMTEELFAGKTARYLEMLSAGMLPLFLYVTFMYGDVIGLAFAAAAVYHEILFIKKGGGRHLLMAAVLIALAISVKANFQVIMIAMAVILLLKWLTTCKTVSAAQNVRMLGGMAAIILLPQVFWLIISRSYCAAFGMDGIAAGAPKLLWIAMSLQEDAPIEYGWYNAYNINAYAAAGFDAETAAAAARISIRESVNNFISRPRFALEFFYRKYISQWNAPCFQSQILNEWSSRHSENLSAVAQTLLYGTGRRIMAGFMNFYHFIVYLSLSAFGLKYFKKIRLEHGLLLLCFGGGILFHLIWEVKPRYALPYFVLILPLAAGGMAETVRSIRESRLNIRRLFR